MEFPERSEEEAKSNQKQTLSRNFLFCVLRSFSHFLTTQTSSKPKLFSTSSAESSPEIASLA
jgi:hypothetical protein